MSITAVVRMNVLDTAALALTVKSAVMLGSRSDRRSWLWIALKLHGLEKCVMVTSRSVVLQLWLSVVVVVTMVSSHDGLLNNAHSKCPNAKLTCGSGLPDQPLLHQSDQYLHPLAIQNHQTAPW